MNNRVPIIVLLLLYCAGSGTIQAQTWGVELKKVRDAYLTSNPLAFDVEVYSYATKMDKTAELVSKGFMKKNRDKYYSSFNNYELLVNGEKAVIIDHERKTLDYYEYEKSKPGVPNGFELNIDSLISATDSIVMRVSKNGLKHFTCFSKNSYIRQTEIFVDAQTHFIKRILYYYIDSTDDFEIGADRVDIFYKNIQTKPIDENFFSFDRYFKRSNSRLLPTGKYQAYQMNTYNSKS